MPRPRPPRAAAPAPAPAPPAPPSPRRLRRASYCAPHRGPRSLSRRRADFDRIARHHLSAPADAPSAPAAPPAPPPLTPAFTRHLLRHPHHPPALRALLARLRHLPNLAEHPPALADPHPPHLHALAELLSSHRFVTNDDPRLRLLVACALAELLRIYAPTPPVPQHRLRDVCALFIEQLAVLVTAQDELRPDRFSLLEQLATTKAFVLFADDGDVVCDVFACFYAVSANHQPVKVREYFADVLFAMLDEMDDIGTDVLDALLAPLVRSLKYSRPAVTLAEAVVGMSANNIQVPLCSMLNASIQQLRQTKSVATPEKHHGGRRRTPTKKARPSAADASPVELSAHHDHVADIIVAINRIAPEILIYVIPNLQERICSSDEEVRLANVHLLARLFTSQHDMSEAYPSLFAEFFSRNRDVSPGIRAEVCLVLPKLMASHRKYAEAGDQILRERALDSEEDVRFVAVQSIGAAVNIASDDLLKILATRLRDRKTNVRHEALKQLVQMYKASQDASKTDAVPADVTSSDSMDLEDSDNAELNDSLEKEEITPAPGATTGYIDVGEARIRKLRWLPNTLLQAHTALKAVGDIVTANEIERVIFERIPGFKSDEDNALRSGLRHFATFLAELDDAAFLHLVHLTQERRRTRDALLRIVEYRLRSRKNPPVPTPTVEETEQNAPKQTFSKRKREMDAVGGSKAPPVSAEMRQLSQTLSRFIHVKAKDPDEAQKLCLSLATAVDLRIFEKIRAAVDENASQAERSAASHDAIARLGSKTPTGRFMQDEVFPKCMPGVFSSLYFATSCKMAVEEAKLSRNCMDPEAPMQQIAVYDDDCPLALCGLLRYLDVTRAHASSLLQHNTESIQALVSAELKDSDSSSDVVIAGLKLLNAFPMDANNTGDFRDLSEVFETNIFAEKLPNVEQGTNLAKWATRAIIRLHAGEPPMKRSLSELAQELTSRLDAFNGNIESIVAPLTSLSQLAKHSPKAFKRVALECFDFARALLCGSLNGRVKAFGQDDDDVDSRRNRRRSQTLSRRSSIPSVLGDEAYVLPDQITKFRASCMAEVVHRSVKLMVYALSLVDSNYEELDEVSELLLKVILEKRGDIFAIASNESSDSENEPEAGNQEEFTGTRVLFAMSRLFAGRGMLYLARHPKFFRRISPPLFVSTVLLAQDEMPDVRINFAKTVSNQILKKRLPFRWVAALPLMAVDPERDNLAQVKSMLTSLFRYRRKVYEKARLQGSASSIQLLPESVLPDMIWVLANLPDVELDRKAGFPESEKCLELILDRLLESNEYAGVLNEYIEGMSIAQDATESEDEGPGENTERIAELGRIAGALLKKKQAGKKWNLSEHPGRITLPKDMFRVINRNAETSGVAPPSLLAVARMYDKDQIRVSTKKEKPNNLVTRIKAGGPTKAGSSVPDAKLEAEATRDESRTPVEQKEETRSRKSPVDSVEPLEEIEHDSEPIEDKMGESLKCDLSPPDSDGTKRGKKRRSHELETPALASAEHSAKTESGKKRCSELMESNPKSEGEGWTTSSDRKRLSGTSDWKSTAETCVKEQGSWDEAKPVAVSVTPSAETRIGAKQESQEQLGMRLVARAKSAGRVRASSSDTKENDAGNSQPDEGQSRRTLPRGKQEPKKRSKVQKPDGKGKPGMKTKVMQVGDGSVPVVRRSLRQRRRI